MVHLADLPEPTPTKTPRGRGASQPRAPSASSPEAPWALDGLPGHGTYGRPGSAAEYAAAEEAAATVEATRHRGADLSRLRLSPPSAAQLRPLTASAPSCDPPFAVFSRDEMRGGWGAAVGAAPPRARAANQWTVARLDGRRLKPEADASVSAAAAGMARAPSPASGGPEAGGELLSASASWMDRSARPSSRAGMRPRTTSQLSFG